MIKTKLLTNSAKAGIVLSAVLLLTLAGCGRNTDSPVSAGQAQSPVVVPAPSPAADLAPSPAIGQAPAPAVLEPDDYVYYPAYGIYYSSNRHQYAYLHGGDWVSQPAPGGVGVDELRASPSVKMDFHDAPANHHAAVVQQYPKNWKPSGPK
jgi:hypothetical protein